MGTADAVWKTVLPAVDAGLEATVFVTAGVNVVVVTAGNSGITLLGIFHLTVSTQKHGLRV